MNAMRLWAALGVSFFLHGEVFAYSERCSQEIRAQCAQVVPGDGRLTACTFNSRKHFSPDCQVEVYTALEQRPRLLETCKEYIAGLCPNVKPINGRLYSCLKLNENEIINPCLKELY